MTKLKRKNTIRMIWPENDKIKFVHGERTQRGCSELIINNIHDVSCCIICSHVSYVLLEF